jgi:hypothetical protein
MKVVSVPNGDYKLVVRKGSRNPAHPEYGGNITLDVGTSDRAYRGTVYITGDLVVEGKQTTVESETATIKDNIIIINSGENSTSPNPGVTLNTSGITVDRGWKTDASILFNESVNHLNSSAASVAGTFTFVNDTGGLIGIQTCSINTNGQNLYLINAAGTGIVSVTGTTDYERNVFSYANYIQIPPIGPLTIIDPDALPNVQALKDYVDSTLAFFDDYSISESNTSVECIDKDAANYYRTLLNPTYTLPLASKIVFKVDGSKRGEFNTSGLDVDNVNIFTNTINNATNNLILTSTTATKIVEVDAVLQLDDKSLSPTAVSGSTKIYTVNSNTTPDPGKTGIYFINQGNSDELVAKNRALLFSILF